MNPQPAVTAAGRAPDPDAVSGSSRAAASFSLAGYGAALEREIRSFGFHVEFEDRQRKQASAIESAFLKANTYKQMILVEAGEALLRDLHPSQTLKIRLEVDTDPPPGFETESQYILRPIPFSVRVYSLPDLFAGKLHALLCRKWKTRVKGCDWYDLVWYIGRHPEVRLSHLESRMRQSGDYRESDSLTWDDLQEHLIRAVENLDVEQARREAAPFAGDKRALEIWSQDFFRQIVGRIVIV